MTTIFISYAPSQHDYTEQMCKEFEAKGYTTWRYPSYPTPSNASYPPMIERAILRSVMLILVWSADASQDAWVERHILFAQSLKKPIFAVLLDSTALPTTLVAVSTVAAQTTGSDATRALMALSNFPPAHSADLLLTLCEQAAHEYIRVRKEAIDAATVMLKQCDRREEVLAVLEYLAKHDQIMGVREKAQEALDAATTGAAAPRPFLQPGDARYMFGVRCKNGHVSYFDKRVVCQAHTNIVRELRDRAGKELDELVLHCTTPGCGLEIVARVDCGDYR